MTNKYHVGQLIRVKSSGRLALIVEELGDNDYRILFLNQEYNKNSHYNPNRNLKRMAFDFDRYWEIVVDV